MFPVVFNQLIAQARKEEFRLGQYVARICDGEEVLSERCSYDGLTATSSAESSSWQ